VRCSAALVCSAPASAISFGLFADRLGRLPPNQSGHLYLVTSRHGQHRLITAARLAISGEIYGIITTLLAGRGSLLIPIAAPIAYLPVATAPNPTFGRISPNNAHFGQYRRHLRRTTEEPFAMFLPGQRAQPCFSAEIGYMSPIRITDLPC
jgi:hypothetical protein